MALIPIRESITNLVQSYQGTAVQLATLAACFSGSALLSNELDQVDALNAANHAKGHDDQIITVILYPINSQGVTMGSRVQIAPYLVNNISMGVNIGPIPDMFDFVATLAHELIHALENGTTEYVDNAAARTAYSLQTELDAFLFQRLVEDQITANVTFPPY